MTVKKIIIISSVIVVLTLGTLYIVQKKYFPAFFMKSSNNVINYIKQEEGFSDTIYQDINGNDTIGYGHLIQSGEDYSNTISESDATLLLMSDLKVAENAVGKYVHVYLTQSQFDSLVEFTYNLGSGTFENSTLLKLINNNASQSNIQNQFLVWDNNNAAIHARRIWDSQNYV